MATNVLLVPDHHMNRLETLPDVANGNGDIAMSAPAEWRKRIRVRVHWKIVLFQIHGGDDFVETTTENLSSDGFYCFSVKPFVAGELLFCRIHIPTAESGCGASHLECRVRVVRVEKNNADDIYGIACRTEGYDVVGCNGHRNLNQTAESFAETDGFSRTALRPIGGS